MTPETTPEPILDFLDDLFTGDAERYDLVVRLRKLVLSVDPRITEEVKYGGILFSAGPPICGLFSYEKHVALEFSRGAELADPHHVLEGEGKLRRHIKLLTKQELFKKNVREYVTLALAAGVSSAAAAKAARGKAKKSVT